MSRHEFKREQNRVIILCASYFDKLGHPLFADKIMEKLTGRFWGRVEIFGIATVSDDFKKNASPNINPVSVICGSYFNINTRGDLVRNYGRIGSIISWYIRFVAVTHFYWRTFRTFDRGTIVIDLECEPIQAWLGNLFSPIRPNIRIGFVIHSIPKNLKLNITGIYKYLSVVALKALMRQSMSRAIFMNSSALESAIYKGINQEYCILGGWGYDPCQSQPFKEKKFSDGQIVILAFGVLRRNKQIDELVDLFLKLDNPCLLLRIVGKSIDVDVSQIYSRISDSHSKTKIEIFDEFVEEDEIPHLFANCHMAVLSHSPGFESMSGPMFLALQYECPILCFSGHTVAALVNESGAGIVLHMEDEQSVIISAIMRLRDWQYNLDSLQRFTWDAIANRMVNW